MALSNDLVSKFVKLATNDTKETKRESTLYGTVSKIENGQVYVKLDGAVDIAEGPNAGTWSELPITDTVEVSEGNRVIVMIKNHAAVITSNLSTPSANKSTTNNISDKVTAAQNTANNAVDRVTQLGTVVAYKADTNELTAKIAAIESLEADSVLTDTIRALDGNIADLEAEDVTINGKLEAIEGKIGDLDVDGLDAKYAKIADLDVTNEKVDNLVAADVDITGRLDVVEGVIENLDVGKLTVEKLDARYAQISELDATNTDVTNLEADVADINTLLFDSATGDTLSVKFANAIVALLSDAWVKDAMVEALSAGKITSGTISTNKVNIMSDDGGMVITNNMVQFKDGSAVKMQIGKDASGKYSVIICDENGTVLLDTNGITTNAVPDGLIVNDMVNDTANIHASKLDIDSLFEEINDSTNTNIIKSTKVAVDEEGQTLDVAFKKMATTESVDELSQTVSSQGARISANAQAISTKVSQQELQTAKDEINQTTTELSTHYSALDQEVDEISATVSSHTSLIAQKADNSTVTTVNNKVSSLEQNLNGFQTTVSETYTTKTEFNDLEIGGRNLAYNTGLTSGSSNFGWYQNTETLHTDEIIDDVETKSGKARKITYEEAGCYGPYWTTTNSAMVGKNFVIGDKYTQSVLMKASTPFKIIWGHEGLERSYVTLTDSWTRYTFTTEATDTGTMQRDISFYPYPFADGVPAGTIVYIADYKMELGNRASDWTPAPEDMATVDSLEVTNNRIDTVDTKVNINTSLIEQLSDSISMLVTDANGASLMSQTENGWTFSTGHIQNTVNSISENLNTLTHEVGDVNSTVDILQQTVDDLGVLGEYIQITTYEDEPCIELGELDSDFKLRITNTRMMFTEGSVVLAYFTNQSFHSKKVVVEEELQQGGFVWKVRSNGNLGLVWKGGNG